MFGDDAYWVGAPPSQGSRARRKGDVLVLTNGQHVVVVATSTIMLKVRPLGWLRRLWLWATRRSRDS